MAASATNTSREIGAVTGVAILGSLMYSQISASLATQMNHLAGAGRLPGLVFNAIETGNLSEPQVWLRPRKLVQEVIGVAYTAFHDGCMRCSTCRPGWRWPPGCSP